MSLFHRSAANQPYHSHSRSSLRHRNKADCVTISLSQQDQQGARKVYVPSVLLSNVMSLAPKLDEVADAITYANLYIACRDLVARPIHDNVVSIPGYNLVRRDRIDVIHGGVCTYIKKGLKYTVLEDLYDDKIEAIWLQLRPSRHPRGLSCIIIANVYHPQTDKGVSDPEILHYLYDSMSTIESHFPNCGVLITGDFYRLDTCVRPRICWTPALVSLQNTTFKTIHHHKRPAGKLQGRS